MCALYMDTGRKRLHLASVGRSGGRADLGRAGGGGMGASWGSFVTLPTTQTNKKPLFLLNPDSERISQPHSKNPAKIKKAIFDFIKSALRAHFF